VNAFDAIYATSAGALNAAYFLGGRSWFPLSIYYDDLPRAAFIGLRNLLVGRPVVDLDYLFQFVIAERKPLDVDAVLGAVTRLHVVVTDVDALNAMAVVDFESSDDLLSCLRASCSMPVRPLGTKRWRGKRVLDGSVLSPLPLRMAIAGGATHVLALCTRPRLYDTWRRPSAAQVMIGVHLNLIKAGLGAGFLDGVRQYWLDRELAWDAGHRVALGSYVLEAAPLPGTAEVSYSEMQAVRLLDAAREAYGVMHCLLAGVSLANSAVRIVPRLIAVSG
jgi:Patatin-like phospholipase